MSPETLSEPRRKLLSWMAKSFLVVWSLGIVGVLTAFLKAPESSHSLSKRTLRLGPLEDFPVGQARLIPAGKEPIWVVRVDHDNLVALSGICTHVRCVLGWNGTSETFDCPCHKGSFDLNGNVLGGPARSPLSRYRVETQLGQVFVRL